MKLVALWLNDTNVVQRRPTEPRGRGVGVRTLGRQTPVAGEPLDAADLAVVLATWHG